jgi:N-carbamoyl-L-amino-acid hydrolase
VKPGPVGRGLRIDRKRLLGDLDNLARIGATPEGGVCRPAFSEADVAGREWFAGLAGEAGFHIRRDGAGNLSAVLPASAAEAKTILTGSHLDTVMNGGRFDGALGVLSGLEAMRTVRDAGLDLPVHLETVSFTAEEGTVLGLFGSLAFSGGLTPEHLEAPRGGRGALGSTGRGPCPHRAILQPSPPMSNCTWSRDRGWRRPATTSGW